LWPQFLKFYFTNNKQTQAVEKVFENMSQGFPAGRRLLKVSQSLKRDKRVLDISETTIHVADVVFTHICNRYKMICGLSELT